MMADRILSLPSHTGENSTYRLIFWAPQFHCNKSNFLMELDLENSKNSSFSIPAFESTWYEGVLSINKYVINHIYTPYLGTNSTYTAVFDVQKLSCEGHSMLFDLNITHTKGVQSTEHSLSDPKPLDNPPEKWRMGTHLPPLTDHNITSYSEDFRAWNQRVASYLPNMTEMALFGSLGRL